MNTYRQSNKFKQLYLWLRWKPWYSLLASLVLVKWAAMGCKQTATFHYYFRTRCGAIKNIWLSHMSLASYKMGDTYTLDELIKELKSNLKK